MQYTSDELKKILDDHRKWLAGEGGSRADLSGADLSNSNLSRANLSGAKLSRANLSGADLYRANLYRADLYRANLSRANLYRADLYRADLSGAKLSRATILIPVNDPRGYCAFATWLNGEWLIQSGCRVFTVSEARAHWGSAKYPDPSRGARYLMALDWLDEWGDHELAEWLSDNKTEVF